MDERSDAGLAGLLVAPEVEFGGPVMGVWACEVTCFWTGLADLATLADFRALGFDDSGLRY